MFAEENETILHASPPKVWSALTRFDDYPRWSPFVRISGQLEQGALVESSFRMRSHTPRFWPVDAPITAPETHSCMTFRRTAQLRIGQQGVRLCTTRT